MVKSIKSLLRSPGQTASCDEIRKRSPAESHQQTRARWTVTGPRRPPAARVQNGAPPAPDSRRTRARPAERGRGRRGRGRRGRGRARAGVKEAARLREGGQRARAAGAGSA